MKKYPQGLFLLLAVIFLLCACTPIAENTGSVGTTASADESTPAESSLPDSSTSPSVSDTTAPAEESTSPPMLEANDIIDITVPEAMTFTKYTKDGTCLGTEVIKMSGTINDVKASITIEPFNGYSDFYPMVLNNIEGGIMQYYNVDYYTYQFMTYDEDTEYLSNAVMNFSPDGEYWQFCISALGDSSTPYFYYASVSGTASMEELVQYFVHIGPTSIKH